MTVFFFWVAAAVVLYTYVGYPLCVATLARVFGRPWKREAWSFTSRPKPVSIVMAVHNGAHLLPSKIEHLLSIDPDCVREVIIVSDGSTDETAQILATATDVRVRSVVLIEQVGKSAALNFGIEAASGDILLFIDIRPIVALGAIAELLSNFTDPKVGCVAGELVLRIEGHDANAAVISGMYWRYEQWIRNCEAQFDSPVGVYGGFYAVRRELAVTIPAGTILDDMYQPLSIIRQGYRSVIDRKAVVYDIWPGKLAGEFSRKVRTLAGNFQLVAIAPWILTRQNRLLFQVASHKLMRLVVPYALVILMLSSFALKRVSSLYLLFGVLQAIFWLIAVASMKLRIPVLARLCAPAGALLSLNAAAIFGLVKFLFTKGPLWKIWSPTATSATNKA